VTNTYTLYESLNVPSLTGHRSTLHGGGQGYKYQIGDWVRFKLSEDERSHHFGSARVTNSVKLQPRWSLPTKIVSVADKRVTVQLLGRPGEPSRDVPITQIELMPTEIPESLAALQMDNIVAETPRLMRKRMPPQRHVNVEEIITTAIDRRKRDYKPEHL
jgi:hypothetical protein